LDDSGDVLLQEEEELVSSLGEFDELLDDLKSLTPLAPKSTTLNI
jgi:hypothetical protein